MKRILAFCGLAATITILIFSCRKGVSKQEQIPERLSALNTTQLLAAGCGTPLVKELEDMAGVGSWGTVTVTNDEDYIILTLNSAFQGMYLGKATISYGSEQDVIDDITAWWSWTPCEGPKTYDRQKVWTPITVSSDTIKIPAANFQADGCIWLSVNVELNGDHGTLGCAYASPYDNHIGSGQWQSAFKYCRQDCPPTDCGGQLRTQTPGGMGRTATWQ